MVHLSLEGTYANVGPVPPTWSFTSVQNPPPSRSTTMCVRAKSASRGKMINKGSPRCGNMLGRHQQWVAICTRRALAEITCEKILIFYGHNLLGKTNSGFQNSNFLCFLKTMKRNEIIYMYVISS